MPESAGTVYAEIRIALDKLTGDIQSVQKSFSQFAQQNRQQAKQVEKSWTDGFKQMKLEHVAAFAAIGLAVKQSIEVYSEFQQSMANTQSVARGNSEEYARMEEAALHAGETTRLSAKEAADAMYYLSSAGMNATQTVEALDGVLQLSQATQSDLAYTAGSVAATLSQFSLAASESGRVANVFAAAIQGSQATMEKLADAMKYAGPVAGAFGISLEDTTAAIMSLVNAGLQGQQAGTVMREVLGYLSDATGPVITKLEKLGVAFEDVNPTQIKFTDALETITKAGIEGTEIMSIFGQRAGPGMLTLLKDGKDILDKYATKITGTNQAAESAAIQNDTLQGSFKRVSNAVEGAQISLTKQLEPALKGLTGFATTLLNGFKELPTFFQAFIAIAAAGIPTVVGLSVAVSVLGGLIGTIAGPITLVVGGLSLLAAGFVAVKKASDDAKIQEVKRDYGELQKAINATDEAMVKLIETAKKTGIVADVVAKMQEKLGITNEALREIIFAFESYSPGDSFEGVRDAVSKISKELGYSKAAVVDILLSSKNLLDEEREQLLILQKQLTVRTGGVSVVEQRRKAQEKAAAERRQQDAEQAARDKAASDAAAKAAEERENEIKARASVEKEYADEVFRTQILLGHNLITQKEAAEQNAKAAETLLEAYIKLGVTGSTFDKLVEKVKRLQGAVADAVDEEKEYAGWREDYEERLRLVDEQIEANENLKKSNSDLARSAGEDRKKYFDTIQADAEETVRGLATFGQAAKGLFKEIGQDLANGELSWTSLGEAAVHALGKIISALGDYLAAEAAKDLVLAIANSMTIIFAYLAPGLFASAAAKAAGATAAYIAGAALEAAKFETGGIVLGSGSQGSGTLVSVAEGGSSELLLSNSAAGQGMMSQFAAEIARQIQGAGGGVAQVIIQVDGTEIGRLITRLTYDGKARIYKGVVRD